MGLFGFSFSSSPTMDAEEKHVKNLEDREVLIAPKVETEQHPPAPSSRFSTSVDVSEPSPLSPSDASPRKPSSAAAKGVDTGHSTGGTKPSPVTRGFSFRSLGFIYNGNAAKPAISTVQEHKKEAKASAAFFRHRAKVPKADKRATESALIVRSLIIGQSPTHPALSQTSNGLSKPQLGKVKSQLMQPKTANKVIAQLRMLSASNRKAVLKREKPDAEDKPVGPVHAVCLDATDAEAERRHFSRLTKEDSVEQLAAESSSPTIANASIDKLANMFKDIHIISLVMTPDFGLGQSGDGDGILSGAVPTAETIINGVEQITPQLMALGLATGNAFLPDHKGVYPPTDRISVLTYWWGLEVVLPVSTIHYLSTTQSIAHTMINLLTALSAMNGGVREILPFVRYISQFIDFEFNAIQGQNRGQGVVCAATWIMPAAMVPRPWDFAPPPQPTKGSDNKPADFRDPSAEMLRPSQTASYSPGSRPSGSRPSDSTVRVALP